MGVRSARGLGGGGPGGARAKLAAERIGVSLAGKSYDEARLLVSNMSEAEQRGVLALNATDSNVVYALAHYGSPAIRLSAIETMKKNTPADYETFAKESLDVWAGEGKDEFLSKFFGSHAGDIRGVWTAHMQEAMSRVGPNKGLSHPTFYPAGIRPPEPSAKVVGFLQGEYERTQSILKSGPKTFTLYRGTNVMKGLPMESWTPTKSIAATFSKKTGTVGGGIKGEVRSLSIPREHVFATSKTIAGWSEASVRGKNEFVVLGTATYK